MGKQSGFGQRFRRGPFFYKEYKPRESEENEDDINVYVGKGESMYGWFVLINPGKSNALVNEKNVEFVQWCEEKSKWEVSISQQRSMFASEVEYFGYVNKWKNIPKHLSNND